MNDVLPIPGNANHHLSFESSPSKHVSHIDPCGHDVAATNFPMQHNNPNDDIGAMGNWLQMSTCSIVQNIGSAMMATAVHSIICGVVSETDSSVIGHVNSVIHCNSTPCNPTLQVTFALPPLDAHQNLDPGAMHFDLCVMPGNDTAPLTSATQTFGTPAPTVNVPNTPSFPSYQTPFLAFRSAAADSHACHTDPHILSDLLHMHS